MFALIEPSMADVMAAIEAADDLPEDKRRHWACSLRVIAKALGKPPELVPARWTALRLSLSRLHHGQMGVAAKTLANHKANVRAALSWFAKEENVPLRGAPLSEAWTKLGQAISSYRNRLFGLRHLPRGGEREGARRLHGLPGSHHCAQGRLRGSATDRKGLE